MSKQSAKSEIKMFLKEINNSDYVFYPRKLKINEYMQKYTKNYEKNIYSFKKYSYIRFIDNWIYTNTMSFGG